MKVYVTKYALTRGILLMEVELTALGVRNVKEEFLDDYTFGLIYAIELAEQRKENKLIQLRKQIEKLEKKNVTTIKEV